MRGQKHCRKLDQRMIDSYCIHKNVRLESVLKEILLRILLIFYLLNIFEWRILLFMYLCIHIYNYSSIYLLVFHNYKHWKHKIILWLASKWIIVWLALKSYIFTLENQARHQASMLERLHQRGNKLFFKFCKQILSSNLRICLDTHMNQNHLTSSEVCIFINFKALHHSKKILKSYYYVIFLKSND